MSNVTLLSCYVPFWNLLSYYWLLHTSLEILSFTSTCPSRFTIYKKTCQKGNFSIIPNTSHNYSSTASTAEVTSPPIMQNRKREHHLNKMKLALPLKQRLQIVADSSQDDSSSSDGTPQRRILHEDPRYEIRGS